jgi:hypothetical protein
MVSEDHAAQAGASEDLDPGRRLGIKTRDEREPHGEAGEQKDGCEGR